MDASATADREPPALHASAPDARAGLGVVSGRAGLGLGLGSQGLAGSYFAAIDGWPLPTFGIGLDVLRAGSTEIRIFPPNDGDEFEALRVRLSLRVPIGRSVNAPAKPVAFFASSFAFGPAVVTQTRRHVSDCDSLFCSVSRKEREDTSSFGVEAGLLARVYFLEFGAVFRFDAADGAVTAVVAPVAGVHF